MAEIIGEALEFELDGRGVMIPSEACPVSSVNGKIGNVTLDAEDVGALPADTEFPVTSVNGKTGNVELKTSDLENDSGYLQAVTPQMYKDPADADDTAAINRAIAAAAAGMRTVYFPNGQYHVSGIELPKDIASVTLVGESRGAALMPTDGTTDALITVRGCNNLTIQNLSLSCGGVCSGVQTVDYRANLLHLDRLFIDQPLHFGVAVDSPTGYVWMDRIRVVKAAAGCECIRIGKSYSDADSTGISPNYLFLNRCMLEGGSAGDGAKGLAVYYGEYITVRECDICNFTGANSIGVHLSAARAITDFAFLGNSVFNNTVCFRGESTADNYIRQLSVSDNQVKLYDGQSFLILAGVAGKAVRGVLIRGNLVRLAPNATPDKVLSLSQLNCGVIEGNIYDENLQASGLGVWGYCAYSDVSGIRFGFREVVVKSVPANGSETIRLDLRGCEVDGRKIYVAVSSNNNSGGDIGWARSYDADNRLTLTLTNSNANVRSCHIICVPYII